MLNSAEIKEIDNFIFSQWKINCDCNIKEKQTDLNKVHRILSLSHDLSSVGAIGKQKIGFWFD